MRILFFSNIPVRQKSKDGYNGGGWISSLIENLSRRPDIEIAVAFFGNSDEKHIESITRYQIKYDNLLKKIVWKMLPFLTNPQAIEKKTWKNYETKIMSVVNDFKPDLIHIFGTERQFGLIGSLTSIPTVIHIQGIINPYFNAFLPPSFSWRKNFFNIFDAIKTARLRKIWITDSYREEEIFSRNRNFIGRTEWDKRTTLLLNSSANYFYGGEILRDDFYKNWEREIPAKLTIVSTISSPIYKGFDTILKTAKLLKKHVSDNFIWKVYGDVTPSFIEKNVKIKHSDVNVELAGVANTETLIHALLNASIYVHPSYIDNSPNSVCEAQMLAVPVIAANVGGLPSIVDNGKTGFLVPANDPYQMASLIQELHNDKELNLQMGLCARNTALERHNRDSIINTLLATYNKILQQ